MEILHTRRGCRKASLYTNTAVLMCKADVRRSKNNAVQSIQTIQPLDHPGILSLDAGLIRATSPMWGVKTCLGWALANAPSNSYLDFISKKKTLRTSGASAAITSASAGFFT